MVSLPHLSTDLLLLHAPAFFEFRGRGDIYFPFLSTSGDVPITPLYEYFPLGFKTLQRYLSERGYDVKIVNLSSVLLCYPRIDVLRLVEALDARLIGIDLHWMVHVQGSLAVAKLLKELRPDMPVVLGGISATFYADQLIQYPYVDMVMRGYDTHQPMAELLEALRQGAKLGTVPNLLWRSEDGQIHDNGFSYKPRTLGCGIDWSRQPQRTATQTLPILELLSTQNAGCAYSCGWCGGSREAFRRVFQCKQAVVHKPPTEVSYEFDTMKRLPGVDRYHFYAAGSYNESRKSLGSFLDQVEDAQFRSINYEQFLLTPDDVLKRMAQANKRTAITLSPDSHDLRVARLAGRGVYTNEELERWIAKALDYGIHQVDIWYNVGMPEQDGKSVSETVDYCQRLLELYRGQRVHPMICPMIPHLDPGSTFFEYPEKHGYRVLYRTVEEHRRGMERASIINRINYETEWLSRRDLVYVGFAAVRRLMAAKADAGLLPRSCVKRFNSQINDALEFIAIVHEVDCITDEETRARELKGLEDEILHRNDMTLCSGVVNQAFPISRQIGGRWFDEMGWEPQILEAIQESRDSALGS